MSPKFIFKVFLLFFLSGSPFFLTVHVFSQTSAKKISGKVTDENGNGVSGVTITVKGTQLATQTNDNGNYSINAPANAVLVLTSVGFATNEVEAKGRNTLNATLSAQSSKLNEVVVVGYGTQRKVDLTGAVASVTRKEFANKPFTSPDQILGGRVAGVNIANRSGDPGAPIDVRIRGVGTTGSNQPLLGVSRMKRKDSSFQCCKKDGSRPTAYVVQTKYANHLKVLYSKDMVLNDQAKGVCKDIRYV